MIVEKPLLPAQYEFVFEDNPFPAIIGGLGSGKTEGGISRLLKLFLEDKGINVAYYMPTYDLIKLRAMGGFEQALDEYKISYKTNQSDYKITVKGYGDIIFRSYERPNRIVAYEVAHSIVDELDTIKFKDAELVWRKVNERNRQASKHPNSIACVTTPDMGYNGFIYYKWFKEKKKGYSVIKASTYDNPFLPPDYIENIKNNYDPLMADLYLRGEIVSLNQKKIYHFFSRQKHHTDRVLTENDLYIYIGQDFNIGGCTSSVWVIDNNIPKMVDEFISHDTHDIVNNITARYVKANRKIEIIPDASGKKGSTSASRSDIAILRDAGFIVNAPESNPPVRDRINSVNAALAHNRMFINTDKCPHHTFALENQAYNDKNEPEKSDTHPSDDDFNDDMGYLINRKFGITITRATISQDFRF